MKKKLFVAGVCAVATFCADAMQHLHSKDATITLQATVKPTFNFDAATLIIANNQLDLLDNLGQPKAEADRTVTYTLTDGAKFKVKVTSDKGSYRLNTPNSADPEMQHTVKVKHDNATNTTASDLAYNTEKEITVADGVGFKIIIDGIVVPENNGVADKVYDEVLILNFTASN